MLHFADEPHQIFWVNIVSKVSEHKWIAYKLNYVNIDSLHSMKISIRLIPFGQFITFYIKIFVLARYQKITLQGHISLFIRMEVRSKSE